MSNLSTVYDPVLEALYSERTRIASEIESIEKFLAKAPNANIRVRNRNGNWYFTEVLSNTDSHSAESLSTTPSEHYISITDSHRIKILNSKHYAQQILRQLRQDLKTIDYMIAHYHPERRAEIYSALSEGRRMHISPLYQPINDIIADFNSAEIQPFVYHGNQTSLQVDAGAIYRTENGEMVRSKSELLIANELSRRGIPYHYEEEITLAASNTVNYAESAAASGFTYHPDFVVLNPRTGKKYIWEHFGRMGDPSYAIDKVGRIRRYIQNGYIPGINLITTFEAESQPLTTDVINAMITNFLE